MSTAIIEQRIHPRAQFFRVQTGGELVSLFSFRPQGATDGIPALVVDLSESGIQILSSNSTPLPDSTYRLELVTGNDTPAPKPLPVKRIWTRIEGVNAQSGFTLQDGAWDAHALAALLESSEHKILRCVLYPVLPAEPA